MRYTVEERLQDSGWEIIEEFHDLLDAVKKLEEFMKCPLRGMGRIIEHRDSMGTIKELIVLPGCGWTKEAAEKVSQLVLEFDCKAVKPEVKLAESILELASAIKELARK